MHRPSGAIRPLWLKLSAIRGLAITFTPPASARSASPARSAWQARCTATSEDEQAVSTTMLGPRRFSV
nr:hypothetical protein [Actinacidiphila yeochonensis]